MSNSELCRCLISQAVGTGYNEDKLIDSKLEQDERDNLLCGVCGESIPDGDCKCFDIELCEVETVGCNCSNSSGANVIASQTN